jgi:RNA polymerase sigma-70 factor (ECF subfamily)
VRDPAHPVEIESFFRLFSVAMLDTPRSLLQRLANQPDETDWRTLVTLYQPFIARWLGRAGVVADDADDLAQEVLTVVVKEVPGFRHSRMTGAFRKWLRTVVVNRTRGYWRSKQTRPQHQEEPDVLAALEDPSSGLSGEWDRDHDAHVARRLLDALEGEFSPTTWTAFRRQVVDGAKAAEVAAELGVSTNAVLVAKSRVLRRFRAEAEGLIENE